MTARTQTEGGALQEETFPGLGQVTPNTSGRLARTLCELVLFLCLLLLLLFVFFFFSVSSVFLFFFLLLFSQLHALFSTVFARPSSGSNPQASPRSAKRGEVGRKREQIRQGLDLEEGGIRRKGRGTRKDKRDQTRCAFSPSRKARALRKLVVVAPREMWAERTSRQNGFSFVCIRFGALCLSVSGSCISLLLSPSLCPSLCASRTCLCLDPAFSLFSPSSFIRPASAHSKSVLFLLHSAYFLLFLPFLLSRSFLFCILSVCFAFWIFSSFCLYVYLVCLCS